MKRRSLPLHFTVLLLAGCGGPFAVTQDIPRAIQGASPQATATPATVALAGNAFITSTPSGATEIINSNGLANWTSPHTIASAWFRVNAAGNVTVAMDAKLAGSASSTVRATVNGTPFTVNLAGAASKTYPIGTVNVAQPGYVRVDLQGVSKSGGYFGDVSAFKVTAAATLNYANDAANYYWSRRGPSVHLGYTAPANTEYFYNEVTVPAGQDKIGSYKRGRRWM